MVRSRPIRTLVAALASLGLVAAISAVPAAAHTCVANGTAAGGATVADGAALAFDASFTCTDVADTGAWSVVVNVSNDSDTEVTIDSVALARLTPALNTDASGAAAATIEATGLPLTLAAGTDGSFELAGDYTLAQVGAGALLNLHLQAVGTSGARPVTLAINVHLLSAGVDLADAQAHAGIAAGASAEAQTGSTVGRSPWVFELIAALRAEAAVAVAAADAEAAAAAGSDVAAAAAAAAAADAGAGAATVEQPAQPAAGAEVAAGARAGASDDDDAGTDASIAIGAGASGQVVVPIGGQP